MIGEIAAFIGVSALVIVTPGQDTALTIRGTLLGGRRSGVYTALGVATGQSIWALATSAGVVALLLASEPLFVALKVLGAAYLVYLGMQAVWHAVRPADEPDLGRASGGPRGLAPGVAFRQGVVSNLANPKMAAFFSSLLPQFVAREEGTFVALLALGLTFALMTLGWLTVYAFAVARASAVLRRSRVRQVLDGLTGGVLIGLGVRLASERP